MAPTATPTLTRISLLALCLCLQAPGGAWGLEVVGIWKMCFEPDLADLYEPSTGYLVLLPDGRYFEMREDCCDGDGPRPETNAYRVEGRSVLLESARPDGTTYERRFELVERGRVVLFDDLYGEPVEVPVLKIGSDLNYGFARIYPPGEPRDAGGPGS